jgi:hypothetical protein
MHFIAQFTSPGGPAPEFEIDQIVGQVEPSDAEDVRDYAWFGTRLGHKWQQEVESTFTVFCKTGNGGIYAIRGDVVEMTTTMPDDQLTRDLYEDYQFDVWWKVKNITHCDYETLDDVPGLSQNDKPAAITFSGQCTFAYWNPEADAGAHTEPAQTHHALEARAPNQPEVVLDAREVLHGVDFSGAAEHDGRNRKIWIATWNTQNKSITLENGSDGRFGRADLADKVAREGGWWIFDFPFGIPLGIAAALKIKSWDEWLEWCHANGDPKARRDAARSAAQEGNVAWSTRRQVDLQWGTTWFPLFEQLYRQTIRGAAEVLYRLRHERREAVCIYPWDDRGDKRIFVGEGFPGATVRRQLHLPATGYKGAGDDRREARRRILDAVSQNGVPIPEQIAEVAINDTEGDGLDALVLLLACRISQGLSDDCWHNARDRDVEGWFPVV